MYDVELVIGVEVSWYGYLVLESRGPVVLEDVAMMSDEDVEVDAGVIHSE